MKGLRSKRALIRVHTQIKAAASKQRARMCRQSDMGADKQTPYA